MSVARRLVAIFYADVAGYSRLTGVDEEGTHRRVMAVLDDVSAAIRNSGGTVLRYAGDAILAVFPSVVLAVDTSTAIQSELAARQDTLGEDERVAIRIGINLGDVIEDRGEVYGEGVNLAARLEAAAAPGGICLSAAAHDQVAGRSVATFVDGGEQAFKNIARPVGVWHWSPGPSPAATATATAESLASELPSIAVLPFANMSSDPEQEFFADGITEDILTELSRFKELFVISRNSVMGYKGKAINVPQVARELGVRYILEGSVRRAGSRVRVTVQLIEAESDRHIWAERYDRQLDDIFDLQDELTRTIVAVLPGRLEVATAERIERKRPENLAAYDCVLAAKLLHHRSRRECNGEALALIDKAISLDPRYAHAHAWRACILGQQWGWGWCEDRTETEGRIVASLETARALDDNDSDVHRILAAVALIYRDLDKAVFHENRALVLNPNDDLIVVQRGEILTWLGEAQEGVTWIRRAMALNPFHPARFRGHLGRAHFVARQYGEALEAYRNITLGDVASLGFVAGAHAMTGETDAAAARAGELLKRDPGFSSADHVAGMCYARDEDRSHHRDALIAAGLPA